MTPQSIQIRGAGLDWKADHAGVPIEAITDFSLDMKAGEVPRIVLVLDKLAGGTNITAVANWRRPKVDNLLKLARAHGKGVAIAGNVQVRPRRVEVINTSGQYGDWMVRFEDRTATPPISRIKLQTRGPSTFTLADIWIAEGVIEHGTDVDIRKAFPLQFVEELLACNDQVLVDVD